jgi:endonuclease/exonuclease/phosphatase family metal-dependent hydrolase
LFSCRGEGENMPKYGVLVWNVENCGKDKISIVLKKIKDLILQSRHQDVAIIYVALLEVYGEASKNVLLSDEKNKKELGQLHFKVDWPYLFSKNKVQYENNYYNFSGPTEIEKKSLTLFGDKQIDEVQQKLLKIKGTWSDSPFSVITRRPVIVRFPKPFNLTLVTAHTKSGQKPDTILQIKYLFDWVDSIDKNNGRYLLAGDMNLDQSAKWLQTKDTTPRKSKTKDAKDFLEYLRSGKHSQVVSSIVSREQNRAKLDWGIRGPNLFFGFAVSQDSFSDISSDHKPVVYWWKQ